MSQKQIEELRKQIEEARGKDYIPYSHPRWNQAIIPIVVGECELTPEEKAEGATAMKELKEMVKQALEEQEIEEKTQKKE